MFVFKCIIICSLSKVDVKIILVVYASFPLVSAQNLLDVDLDPDAGILGNFIKPIKNNGNVVKPINENMNNYYNIWVEQHHHFHGTGKKKTKEDLAHPLGMAGQVSQVSVLKLHIILLFSIISLQIWVEATAYIQYVLVKPFGRKKRLHCY